MHPVAACGKNLWDAMRRWNGWGDDTIDHPVSENALEFLTAILGKGAPPKDADLTQVCAAVDLQKSRLPPHSLVTTNPEARLRASFGQSYGDWIRLRFGEIDRITDGVAFPESNDDIRALLEWAGEIGAIVIPCGGATSVVGHLTPPASNRPVLTLSTARMSKLLSLDALSQLATFQAGVCGPELEAKLREQGWTLGHFPQSFEYSSLGGWITTRSSGQQSSRYGRIESLFAGGVLETPTGQLRIPHSFPASAAGPDLREWVLGSEGRLGVLSEATMRISRLPEQEVFIGVILPDWSCGEAIARALAQNRVGLSMMRLSNPIETQTTLRIGGHAGENTPFGAVLLMMGFTGSPSQIDAMRNLAAGIIQSHGADCSNEKTAIALGKAWEENRFRGVYLRNGLWSQGYGVDTMETAVNWPNVEGMMNTIESAGRDALSTFGENTIVYTHLSHVYPQGSSVYTTFIFRTATDFETSMSRWRHLKKTVSEAIVEQGGTISHQHGVGKDHAPFLLVEKTARGMDALQSIVNHFDPNGVMASNNLLGSTKQ